MASDTLAALAADPDTAQLTFRHLHALDVVCTDFGTTIGPSDIAAAMKIQVNPAWRAVEVLISRGLAERADDPDDRRRTIITPTEKGRALAARIVTAIGEPTP